MLELALYGGAMYVPLIVVLQHRMATLGRVSRAGLKRRTTYVATDASDMSMLGPSGPTLLRAARDVVWVLGFAIETVHVWI